MTGRAKMRTRCAAALAALLALQAPDLRGNQEGAYIAPQAGWLWVVDSDDSGADGKVRSSIRLPAAWSRAFAPDFSRTSSCRWMARGCIWRTARVISDRDSSTSSTRRTASFSSISRRPTDT